MIRNEHIEWMKDRANAEMDYYKDPIKGVISVLSDLRKHPETNSEALASLCMMALTKSDLTRYDVIDFIEGLKGG